MSWKFPGYQNDKIMSWCVMIGNESAGQKYALYKIVWNNKLGCVEIWIRRTSSFLRGGVEKDRYLVTWWGSIQANVTEQVPKMSQVGYHLRDNRDVTSSDKMSSPRRKTLSGIIIAHTRYLSNHICYQSKSSYSWWWVIIDGSRSTRHAQRLIGAIHQMI